MRLNDFVPQETVFWRRRIWDRVGGLDTSYKFALDWDLLLRFQAAGAHIVRVPYFLACFRTHAAQKTAAVMHSTGQQEITQLRERTQGRPCPPHELERDPRLLDPAHKVKITRGEVYRTICAAYIVAPSNHLTATYFRQLVGKRR